MTTTADLFVPEVLADAVAGAIAGRRALDGTGAFNIVPGLPENAQTGGVTVNVPYFGHLGELEARTDGQALTVATLTSEEEKATVVRAGKAFEVTNWGQQAAAGDPYAEASRQMADAVLRQFDRAALNAALTTSLIADKKTEKLSYAHFVQLLDLFGDEQEDVVAFGMHSKVLAAMRLILDGNDRPIFVDARDGGRPTVLGRPVFVSDRHTVTEDGGGAGIPTYKTIALKRGAGVIWVADGPRVDTDKDILADSKVASVNVYYAPHLYKRYPGQTKPGAAVIETQA